MSRCQDKRVTVSGDVRLYGGKEGEGIVQIHQNSTWKTICDLNFHGIEARVVCRQLGFSDGFRLPVAAYGEYADIEPYPEILQSCSTGQETRLVDCTFDANVACSPTAFVYASVKCFDNIQPPTGKFQKLFKCIIHVDFIISKRLWPGVSAAGSAGSTACGLLFA